MNLFLSKLLDDVIGWNLFRRDFHALCSECFFYNSMQSAWWQHLEQSLDFRILWDVFVDLRIRFAIFLYFVSSGSGGSYSFHYFMHVHSFFYLEQFTLEQLILEQCGFVFLVHVHVVFISSFCFLLYAASVATPSIGINIGPLVSSAVECIGRLPSAIFRFGSLSLRSRFVEYTFHSCSQVTCCFVFFPCMLVLAIYPEEQNIEEVDFQKAGSLSWSFSWRSSSWRCLGAAN